MALGPGTAAALSELTAGNSHVEKNALPKAKDVREAGYEMPWALWREGPSQPGTSGIFTEEATFEGRGQGCGTGACFQ